MTQPKLTLFLDPVSPFAHMAYYVVRTNPTFKGCEIDLVPVFLGGVMQSSGNRPPLSIPSKGAQLAKDRARWVKQFKIPMADGFPEPFPQSTIQTSRALCAIKATHPDKLPAAFVEMFNALWIDLKPVGKPEVYAEYLSRVFNEAETKEIVQLASQPEFKKQLNDNTDYALKQGCFGLPYFIATNANGDSETFWGFDHIVQVIDHLGLERQGEGFRSML